MLPVYQLNMVLPEGVARWRFGAGPRREETGEGLKNKPLPFLGKRLALRSGLRLFNCFNNLLECLGLVHRQVGQHLAVEADTFGVEFTHKFGIGHSVVAGCGVDTYNPQAAEVSFLLLAMAVSERKTSFDGVFGDRPNVSP